MSWLFCNHNNSKLDKFPILSGILVRLLENKYKSVKFVRFPILSGSDVSWLTGNNNLVKFVKLQILSGREVSWLLSTSNPVKFIKSAKNIINPNGRIFISTCANCAQEDHLYRFKNIKEIITAMIIPTKNPDQVLLGETDLQRL